MTGPDDEGLHPAGGDTNTREDVQCQEKAPGRLSSMRACPKS